MARAKSRKRRKPRIRIRTKPGAVPGTIKVDPDAPRPQIRVVSFDSSEVVESEEVDVRRATQIVGERTVTWINVDGLGDETTIRQFGKAFSLHPLALEDVVNVHQRAKIEEYDESLYVVVRMVTPAEHFRTEQVSIFLGKNFVLTFQERAGDCFDPIRTRIRKGTSRMRRSGPDYLAYRLIDAVVDGYFPVLEEHGDRLERLDSQIEEDQSDASFAAIQDIKSELVLARRAIRPHRDAVNSLLRDPQPQVSEETRLYLRDCYDHTVQLIELVETYREICGDLRDYHQSIVSNRMNETMKVLTMIATIFIPLGFIAGLYVMNFSSQESHWNMPELNWAFGYPIVLCVMAAVAAGMTLFFRRRGWLGSRKSRRDDSNIH